MSCKLSGMATEADWNQWQPQDFEPYLNTLLESFGPKRLMFGSDWPVCNLATNYSTWIQTIQKLISSLSSHEQDYIMSKTASRVYNIKEN